MTASRTTILHVEDDSNDVLLFQHACQKAGILLELQNVPDGHDAIAYLRGEEKYQDRERYPLPDVVLLDLKMPRMSGVEVLTWMRQGETFRRMPVVVLSSSNHEADVRRAYDAGANSYLMKPVDFNALVELAKMVHRYWLKLNEPPE